MSQVTRIAIISLNLLFSVQQTIYIYLNISISPKCIYTVNVCTKGGCLYGLYRRLPMVNKFPLSRFTRNNRLQKVASAVRETGGFFQGSPQFSIKMIIRWENINAYKGAQIRAPLNPSVR